jgi:lambda repressor-like predicted transcriptional regulator
MKKSDLANLNSLIREMILRHMEEQNITLNAFSKQAGVHQNQLWLYLYSGKESKGLHSSTLEKIGRYLSKN